MIFHDREDLLQGEGGDYEAVPCRLEQQDTEGLTVGVEGGQTSLYEPCIFCSSVFSVRKRTHPPCEKERLRLAGEFLLSRRIFLSLTELTDLTEPFCAQFRAHRTPSAYRFHRGLITKGGCKVL